MRFFPILRLILALAVPGVLAVGQGQASSSPAFRVIVNPVNPVGSVDRRFLAEAFLKKLTRWTDGEVIRPVDQAPDSGTRQRFSEDVLGRAVPAVQSYWQQLVFSGREVPPPELDTDEAVVRYVLKHPGAIGYVSAGAAIDRAKPVLVR